MTCAQNRSNPFEVNQLHSVSTGFGHFSELTLVLTSNSIVLLQVLNLLEFDVNTSVKPFNANRSHKSLATMTSHL